MRLGYEDWEFNIRLGASKIMAKGYQNPISLQCKQFWMLISKSSKHHAQIVHYIIEKILIFII